MSSDPEGWDSSWSIQIYTQIKCNEMLQRFMIYGILRHKGEGGQICWAVNQSKQVLKKGHNENITRMNEWIYIYI